MARWLRGRKGEGLTVVGVEQTDTSVIIGMPEASAEGQARSEPGNHEKAEGNDEKGEGTSTNPPTLPKNSIIIMGAEKTGIPADVLVECDICVEIKQWGVTRSLNVQTAASCVLFEWRRIWGDGR